MKLRKPRVTNETKVRLIADYNGGMLIEEILKRYAISQGTLYRIINQKINSK